jgi:excisionase family DNA binding protein
MPIESLYTTKQTAEVLGVSVQTVVGLIHEGRLKAGRVGYRFRVRPADIEKFLERSIANAAV